MVLPFSAMQALAVTSIAHTPFSPIACSLILAPRTLALPAQTFFSQEEQKRIELYLKEEDKQSFRVSRFLARQGCAALMRTSPKGIHFNQHPLGKPYILSQDGSPYFNISHSDAWCAVALHATIPLGVDIQLFFSPADIPLGRVCHPQDCLSVRTQQEMTLLWSIKEATVKASGLGLHTPLEQICIHSTAQSQLFVTTLLQQEYYVHAWVLPDNYIVTLAYAAENTLLSHQEVFIFQVCNENK